MIATVKNFEGLERPSRDPFAQRFEQLREHLAQHRESLDADKPLAYWSLPVDRWLPRPLLQRPLDDVLALSWHDVQQIPSIGPRKLATLVQLLSRALQQSRAESQSTPNVSIDVVVATAAERTNSAFDPQAVAEHTWEQWRREAVAHELESAPLGQFVRSLRHLPRTSWRTPLGNYTRLTLAEIRLLRAHGRKRMAAIIRVFHELHRAISSGAKLSPSAPAVPAVTEVHKQWQDRLAANDEVSLPPNWQATLLDALLRQTTIDLGSHIAELARKLVAIRLAQPGLVSVHHPLGLSRARAYQILNDVALAVRLRWPTGGRELRQLLDRLPQSADHETRNWCEVLLETFFTRQSLPPLESGG
ncbi:MAG: hypothetical protein JSS27_07140 [Planctomycetes bacterium]|nr:hypothetical protein [Planctomycetota bacterium]